MLPSENGVVDYLGSTLKPNTRMLREIKSHPSHLHAFPQHLLNHLTAADALHRFSRQHRHSLPQLLIPSSSRQYIEEPSPIITPDESPITTPGTTHTITPDTPQSSSSPIAGVIDLTHAVRTLDESPVTTGGFSDIYRGEWTKDTSWPGRQGETVLVAIKLLRFLAVSDHYKARKKLNWEVYIWHRLEHPNIVKLFGTSYHMSGRPAMVMRWYKNGSATEYLRGRRDQEVDRKALVLDIARGLNYLHTLTPPIIHGDLKGNNVLITDDGQAVLSDFGLSQAMEALLDGPTGFTPSNPDFGPPRWQAPELLEDDACQPGLATDVWSFGCTAYEILSGNLPYFYRVRDALVIRDIQSGIKPPGPAGLVLDEPDQRLQIVLNRCWSSDPFDRFHMAAVVSELESL